MTSYTSNLTDKEWILVEPFVKQGKMGRPRSIKTREVVNAVLYVIKTGCQWRFLPSDFPNWHTVYDYYRDWKLNGSWDKLHDSLRDQVRLSVGKKINPTVAIIDSQSVKTVQSGNQRGFDAGKKTKGRKRHIAVDTMGFLLAIVVHAASIQDRVGARALLLRLSFQFTSIVKIFADGGYTGKLVDWTCHMFHWTLTIIKRCETGFKILPKRWIVERTFGWLNFNRRLSKDFEKTTTSSETMVKIAMIRLMLRRLKT